jgi:hypothetical protein
MILPFSTQLNGKPTYFPEKILKSLLDLYQGNEMIVGLIHESVYDYSQYKKDDFINILDLIEESKPKKHTIREDKKDRWQFGYLIDFFINTRTVNMFRFAPRINVVRVQKIEIIYNEEICESLGPEPAILVDGVCLNIFQIEKLAENDGFDSVVDFFNYFNTDFTGKLIHWTDLKY